jgi:hypothetical protein
MHHETKNNEEPIQKINIERAGVLWKRDNTPNEQQNEPPKLQPGFAPIVALCMAVSIVASLATVAGYDRWYAQKVVAVDIKGYIAQQRDSYLAGKLNDDELKRNFDRLEDVITAIPKNRVIIMGDAVVRNAETVKP